MANPQKEDGHVDIANDVMDALIRTRIPGEQRQCLDFIIRKTWGWGKTWDKIPYSQFVKSTGISKSHVVRALKNLEKHNMIQIKGVPKDGYLNIKSYRFQKDFEKWKGYPKKGTGYPILDKGVPNIGQKGTQYGVPQKTISKDNISKDNYITGAKKRPPCPYLKIIEIYHKKLPMLPTVQSVSKTLKETIRARWNESKDQGKLEWWDWYFSGVAECDFLIGKKTDWMATFPWLVGPKNMTKVLNGNYVNKDREKDAVREFMDFMDKEEVKIGK